MIFFPCKVGNGTVASVRNLEPNTDYYFRISYRIPGEGGIMLEGPLSEVALHRTGMPGKINKTQGFYFKLLSLDASNRAEFTLH